MYNNSFQEWICLFLRITGIPWFLREVFARRKVTIINYHNPRPDVFELHMARFSQLYNFIGIDHVTEALERHDFSSLPDKSLLVTLDDGHIGNRELVDTIVRYHIPAVIYVVAGLVGTRRGFWFNQLSHTGKAMSRLKNLPDDERRSAMWNEYGHADDRSYDEASVISSQHMTELLRIGCTIGSHTLFHPLLNRCDELTGQKECSESKRLLEEMTGITIHHFAFPDGKFDARAEKWLQSAGYRTARTIHPGWVTEKSAPLALPDLGISDNAGLHKAIVQASGLWSFLRPRY